MTHPVEYVINTAQRKAHIYGVTLSISEPCALLTVSLPCWIPGSYMVRDFARFISGLQAHQGATACEVIAQDLSTWRIIPQGSGELFIRYEVYAFDTSVRAAFLDEHRGFFNATSLCVRVHGYEHFAHTITLDGLAPDWRVATAMPHFETTQAYEARNYDELVDHPFELGNFWHGSFEAGGAVHECVVTGAWPSADYARLLQDMQRICAAHIAFWHGSEGRAPFERYVIMLHLTEDGYGGLEHRASTALMAACKDLPRQGDPRMTDGYITLLGLISHEYFHAWNVKRLVPSELLSIDYQGANHTKLLWFFEGFTSYYDDLMLLRAGLIDEARYLKLLSKNWMGMLNMPGRYAQSVAQASFDAWGKYYRVDENTPNITVSYYSKGAMVALCLDLSLRRDDVGSLDDVMRSLWQTCTEGTAPENHDGRWPVTEALIAEHIHKIAPHHHDAEWWKVWVHGVEDLPIAGLLEAMGIQTRVETQGFAQQWGLRLSEGPVTGCVIRSVLRHSGAEQAGLCAGDEIIGLNGWRVRKLDDAAQALEPNATVSFCIARGQRIFHFNATLPPSSTPVISHIDCSIPAPAADRSEAAQQAHTRRAQWLYSLTKSHA